MCKQIIEYWIKCLHSLYKHKQTHLFKLKHIPLQCEVLGSVQWFEMGKVTQNPLFTHFHRSVGLQKDPPPPQKKKKDMTGSPLKSSWWFSSSNRLWHQLWAGQLSAWAKQTCLNNATSGDGEGWLRERKAYGKEEKNRGRETK